MSIIESLLKLFSALDLFLIELLSSHLVCWVLKVRLEVPQMPLLAVVVLLLDAAELSLLAVKSSQHERRVLPVEVLEHRLRDDLAQLNQLNAALSKLTDGAEAEVFCLAAHTLQEGGEVFGDFLCTYQILRNVARVELSANLLALLGNALDCFLVLEVSLSGVLETERPQVLKLLVLALVVNSS